MPAARVDATAHAPAGPQWVAFRCAGRRCAAPLEQVRQILAPVPFARIPGSGPEVCGLAGVRGRVVTVLDLGVLLGGPASAGGPDHRLLLIEQAGRLIGLVVDEVMAVGHAEAERVADGTHGDAVGGDVLGTCRLGVSRHVALRLDRIAARVMG